MFPGEVLFQNSASVMFCFKTLPNHIQNSPQGVPNSDSVMFCFKTLPNHIPLFNSLSGNGGFQVRSWKWSLLTKNWILRLAFWVSGLFAGFPCLRFLCSRVLLESLVPFPFHFGSWGGNSFAFMNYDLIARFPAWGSPTGWPRPAPALKNNSLVFSF